MHDKCLTSIIQLYCTRSGIDTFTYRHIIRNITMIYLSSLIKYFERFRIFQDSKINNEKKHVQVVNSHHHNKADDDLMAHKITF